MAEVPDLREGCSIHATSEIRNGTSLSLKGVLDLGQRVSGLVRRSNSVGRQQIVGGVTLETTEER